MEATVTAADVRKLLREKVIDRDEAAALIDAVDPPAPLARWRAFAHTLLPVAVALGALAVAAFAATFVDVADAALIGFGFGAAALLVTGVVVAGRRALLPAGVGTAVVVVVTAVFAKNTHLTAGDLHRDAPGLLIVAVLLVLPFVVWAVSRVAPRAPLEATLAAALPSARHVAVRSALDPASGAARIAAIVVVTVFGLAAVAGVVAGDTSRSPLLPALGALLLAGSAIGTRRATAGLALRTASIAAGLVALAWLVVGLERSRDVPWPFVLPVVLALTVAALASRPWRIALTAALTTALLSVPSALRMEVEKADDVVAILLAAGVTLVLVRGTPRGALGVAAATALLVLSSVEISAVGGTVGLNLGSATSLGAIACLLVVAHTLTRHASVAARALVAALVILFGALFINEPALLLASLVLVLARRAREPALEAVAVAAVFAAAFVAGNRAVFFDSERVVLYGLGAAVVTLAIFTLRRLKARTQLGAVGGSGTPMAVAGAGL